MQLLKKNIVLFVSAILFIVLNGFLIYQNLYYGILLPFVLLIVWFAFVKINILLLIIVFFTPLSVLLSDFIPETPVDLSIPTEPILAGLLLVYILKITAGQSVNKGILKHPVSISIYIYLFWMFFTSISSTMPLVSAKFFIARLWLVIPLYFMAANFFKNQEYIKKYLWAFIIPLTVVMIYMLFNLISVGLFIKNAAHGAMNPFFNDHTSYGAIIAMFIPIIAGFLFFKGYNGQRKLLLSGLLAFYFFALTFSYSRAAWISIIAAIGVFVVVFFKVDKRLLLLGTVGMVVLFFIFQFEITDKLSKNRQDSSQDLSEHVSSISNIATDASNLERINRWNSAFNMFEEKPIFGFGPGTYMFQYAPYQMSYDRTIISTDFGDGGNAHSEYIGPLAESGMLGMLTFLGVIIMTVITGVKVYYRAKKREFKILSLVSLLGLVTYYIHGFLNNFLDTDKASVPFWGFTAIIVAIDVFHETSDKNK
ncbi:MAG: O-antigen ligase family protein [Bacteroidales bacterium]|nr:O-antigen ligase family protein [Bacteroidales bacterium]